MNGQLALLLLAILGAANARTALAAPANPCAQANLPNSISKLYQRLTETEDATVLGRVSSAAIDLLPKFQSAREQSCLAYIAGSASFILSSARNERAQYAHQAVRWPWAMGLGPRATCARAQPMPRPCPSPPGRSLALPWRLAHMP